MQLSADEIKILVDRVKERLEGLAAQTSPLNVASNSTSYNHATVLRSAKFIDSRLITYESIVGELHSVKQIQIPHQTVITPSARDLLKERGVEIVRHSSIRTEIVQTTRDGNSVPIVVAGSASWLPFVTRRICPKQAQVLPQLSDEATSLREISNHISDTIRMGVLIVEAPHAACLQAAREDRLRPVVLGHWSDFDDVFREVSANLVILSSKRWTAVACVNLIRKLYRLQVNL